ncbi:hypothetical protein E2C01_054527 [Portunus trituberculatus]|uniref:Uncharacterized protein n=1 Tax=Portunus trituberculatus TaxID=210409 RepID=A0A5B7GNW5_PORTR|nr:hypothetical protein [Portunus trituberculatus]
MKRGLETCIIRRHYDEPLTPVQTLFHPPSTPHRFVPMLKYLSFLRPSTV